MMKTFRIESNSDGFARLIKGVERFGKNYRFELKGRFYHLRDAKKRRH
jgi:hypothetical protein